jgi:hypothetical protein
MKKIRREIRKLCTRADRKLAKLKRKYRGNQTLMKRLNDLEENIESPPLKSRS